MAYLLLAACGGGGGSAPPRPADPPSTPPPAPPPPPPADRLREQIVLATNEILADTCFRQGGTNCAWTERAYDPAEFAMTQSTGEALLVVDRFPTLPVRALRFRNRIRGYFRLREGGVMTPASSIWRVPTALWSALGRFAGPDHVASHRLNELSAAIASSYGSLTFDNVGHGSYVFSLLVDTNPHQPLVILDAIDLSQMARADYCDASGSAAGQQRLVQTAERAADEVVRTMRTHNVRFVNYSAGHTLGTITASWQQDCGTPPPPDPVLRAKLAAYAPIYAALFNTPGVLTVQAAAEGGDAADTPYDQRSPSYGNRLRAGYFTSLDSGLDPDGRGNYMALAGWPERSRVDIYLNTGVLPQRPFQYNRTPLLQIDDFGVAVFPITGSRTSWVAPLGLSLLINLRYAAFGSRPMDNSLVAAIFDAATPGRCSDLPEGRCLYQDPLLHGRTEAVRLQYRPLHYPFS
jgi:hypothetical protein